jgi:hypothetical protein
VAGSRPVVEESAARARPGSTGDAQEESGRVVAVTGDPSEEDLFPAEHPFIRLEPATRPDDMPHLCATDGTPLYKGNIGNALLHAYTHPAALRRRARPVNLCPVSFTTEAINMFPSSPLTTMFSVRWTSFKLSSPPTR